ncbi:MAG: hypothetical protein HC819_03720 [Cyclobacteriaceae bacterium]|nr:hypothetical protein [Cyclobacteriaceae bacterium]
MKRAIFYLAVLTLSFSIFSCAGSIPQHCPSYHSAYGKEKYKKTKGVNKNVFANGIKGSRYKADRF